MTLAELDKFYQLGNIEGLAFVNDDGLLIEDQLVLSSTAAASVAHTFFSIHDGLKTAERKSRGFLVKFSNFQFVSVKLEKGFLILQLNPDQPVNQFFEQAITMASYNKDAPSGPPTDEPVESPTTEESVDEGLLLTWQDFQTGLVKALTRVAPSNLVTKLKDDAIETSGILPDEVPTLEQMRSIGENAVNLVPNKGRRKMVEKELKIVLQNLGL